MILISQFTDGMVPLILKRQFSIRWKPDENMLVSVTDILISIFIAITNEIY